MTRHEGTLANERQRAGGAWRAGRRWLALVVGALTLALAATAPTVGAAPLAVGGSWSTYQGDNGRSGFNASETAINPATASALKLHWTHHAGGGIVSQPIEANGLIYWGSWDGYEHATNPANGYVWATYLGQTRAVGCDPTAVGVTSTATVALLGATPVVYVGGGDANFYALNANTGQKLWSASMGSSPSHFIWSSPAVYNGSVYVGVASFGDCPLVQGQLVQLNAATGAVQHIFNVVPNGCLGGGIWGSPSVDQATGVIYVATGNPGSCAVNTPYTEAVVALRAADLAYIGSWQVRGSDHADLDFGSTPTLFTATIAGVAHAMLGVTNKDGMYYALDRANVSHGPLWRANIAHSGACPQCKNGSISSGAWDGAHLYVAGGQTSINGVTCSGSIRALDPATGAFIWQHCLQAGPALGAVVAAHGIVFLGEGNYILGIATASGQTLFRFLDSASGSNFWGAASISNGVLYMGNMDGALYAFGA